MGRNLLSIFEGILPFKQHLLSNNKHLPATLHRNHLETEARSPCWPAPHRGHAQKEEKGPLCTRVNILYFSCIESGKVYNVYQMGDNFNWSESFHQAANARERKRMDGVNAAFLRQNKFYSSFFASNVTRVDNLHECRLKSHDHPFQLQHYFLPLSLLPPSLPQTQSP